MRLLKCMHELEFKATGAFAFTSYMLWLIFILETLIRILERVIK